MSFALIQKVNEAQKKPQVVDVLSGDTVKVHQKVREGNKERVQIFEGVVIRVDRKNSHTSRITVRKVTSGVGVEKSFLMHSPLVTKVEVMRRSKVRRNYLSYLRNRSGKSARLNTVDFDKDSVNAIRDEQAEAEEVRLKEQTEIAAQEKAAEKAAEEAELAKKQAEVESRHEGTKDSESAK